MSTQLTISIELITFMEWILKHKSDVLSSFISHAVDDNLKKKLVAISANKELTMSNDDLYTTLSHFVRYMEECVNEQIDLNAAQEEWARSCTRRSSKHRHHSARCTRKEPINETESIKSPTQRTLYQALARDESESSVH